MAISFHTCLVLLSLVGRHPISLAQEAGSPPAARAHSHNDYEHSRPLLDALDQGFCSVEADIYLVEGQLLVAHDRPKVRPERTLQSLYLEPLQKRVVQNGGRVYKGGPPIVLLIDVKSDADATWTALQKVLDGYTNILSRFYHGQIETNAVTAIISGNRATARLAAEPSRYAAIDGRPEDLQGTAARDLIPLISEDWKRLFQWRGVGPFSPDEKARLREFVEKAHHNGRKVRFWGTPDNAVVWEQLWEGQVDLINTDDLPGLRAFLQSKGN